MLFHFALVLHFAAILITFCGDYYILRRNRRPIMEVAHGSIMGGHMGIKKTTDKIQSAFHWPRIQGDVTRFCKSCDVCQKTVSEGSVPKVPLEKMPLIDKPFKRVAIDLVGPDRKSVV